MFPPSPWSTTCGQIGNHSFTQNGIFIPHQLVLNERIIDAECGHEHNVLLTANNNVVTFGYNEYNQCSWILSKDENINKPYILNKEKEIGIKNVEFVEKVFAFSWNTIIIINKHKKCKIALK